MKASPTLACWDERRRQAVRNRGRNGIDYVEIVDDAKQTELCVHLFRNVPEGLTAANLRIRGGQRVRNIHVLGLRVEGGEDSEAEACFCITVDQPGDFSTYKLCIVALDEDGRPTNDPFPDFDPRYACAEFSFKVGCPSDLDCKTEPVCPPEKRDEPEINYLAKDYASFRQLILDRLALLVPDWTERHVPDLGIALVEVLAYVGDYLSYYQDAVATEAYLNTARERISVRRHARLVDYLMHEGCNARAWVTIDADQDVTDSTIKLRNIYFTTGAEDSLGEVFEPLVEDPEAALALYATHSTMNFYTWGDEQCCLPKGATEATLRYDWQPFTESETNNQTLLTEQYTQSSVKQRESVHAKPEKVEAKLPLKKGDVLIFEEVKGPKTGNPADADPARRWAVRLTKVSPAVDALCDPPISIVDIEWAAKDALPFPFCVSARLPAPDCTIVHDISVAHGNVILVDHGQTVDPCDDPEQVGIETQVGECACEGSPVEMTTVPEVFRLILKKQPLTFSEKANWRAPASKMLREDPHRALPQIIALNGLPTECPKPGEDCPTKPRKDIDPADPEWKWHARRDLLQSESDDQHFVVEIDNDGRAHLRFGDGELGHLPEACMIFQACYRVGNGTPGNVGADTITRICFRNQMVSGLNLRPRNPLPAQGGTNPELMSEVKLFAPGAICSPKDIQRAITADDYAQIVEREFSDIVQRAGASLNWTGSWYAAQIAVDPLGSETADERLLKQIKRRLHRYRRMGHDVEVRQAQYVPLNIEMQICVLPHYLRGHVEAALLDVLSNQRLADSTLGFFHPDNLTFGEGIYVSKLVAVVQAVPGVESVCVTRFERLGEGNQGELENGILSLGSLEVAQLDNDPNFPEHGKLTLTMQGGR
jgi:hypothetical protein